MCYLVLELAATPRVMSLNPGRFLLSSPPMLREMRQKLSSEIGQLSHELNVVIPQAIAHAVELGDLRENSEYKARPGAPAVRPGPAGPVAPATEPAESAGQHRDTSTDRVGLGSKVTVVDLSDATRPETFMLVLAEMMDLDAGHISLRLASGSGAQRPEGGR